MTAAVKAGNPPDFAYTTNVSIAQLNTLDLVEDVSDVVAEAEAKYGKIMPGMNAAKTGQFDGKWKSIPYIGSANGYFARGDKLKEKGIDPAVAQDLERSPRGGAGDFRPGERLLRLGLHAQQGRRRQRLLPGHHAGLRWPLHRRDRHQGDLQLARDRRGLRVAGRDLRPQRQVRGDDPAGRRELDGHRQQRSLGGRQHRLHAERVQRLRRVQEGQPAVLQGHARPARADRQQRRQPRRRAGAAAGCTSSRARRTSTSPRSWRSICSTRTTSTRSPRSPAACSCRPTRTCGRRS